MKTITFQNLEDSAAFGKVKWSIHSSNLIASLTLWSSLAQLPFPICANLEQVHRANLLKQNELHPDHRNIRITDCIQITETVFRSANDERGSELNSNVKKLPHSMLTVLRNFHWKTESTRLLNSTENKFFE